MRERERIDDDDVRKSRPHHQSATLCRWCFPSLQDELLELPNRNSGKPGRPQPEVGAGAGAGTAAAKWLVRYVCFCFCVSVCLSDGCCWNLNLTDVCVDAQDHRRAVRRYGGIQGGFSVSRSAGAGTVGEKVEKGRSFKW